MTTFLKNDISNCETVKFWVVYRAFALGGRIGWCLVTVCLAKLFIHNMASLIVLIALVIDNGLITDPYPELLASL